jgi:hypothetical protein
MCRKLLAVLIAAATMAVVAQAVYATTVKLEVLSSKPNQVSGGDALVRVDAPANLLGSLRVKRNGADVTDASPPREAASSGS